MSNFRYTTKPVTVEAFKLSQLESTDTIAMPGWLMPAIMDGTLVMGKTSNTCMTKQGSVAINPDDWLIRLDDGEIYPCSDEIFQKKYEKQVEARTA